MCLTWEYPFPCQARSTAASRSELLQLEIYLLMEIATRTKSQRKVEKHRLFYLNKTTCRRSTPPTPARHCQHHLTPRGTASERDAHEVDASDDWSEGGQRRIRGQVPGRAPAGKPGQARDARGASAGARRRGRGIRSSATQRGHWALAKLQKGQKR
jgi:hypothetical protein